MADEKVIEKIMGMFDFLHDVIMDINQESEEWNLSFDEEYDSCIVDIKKALEEE